MKIERLKDIATAHVLGVGSAAAQLVPSLARRVLDLQSPQDVLLRWRPVKLYDNLWLNPLWAHIDGLETADSHDIKTWGLGLIAVSELAVEEALCQKGARLAVAYRLGTMGMVGVRQVPNASEPFLSPVPTHEGMVGVTTRIGKGDYDGAIGIFLGKPHTFRPLRTIPLGMVDAVPTGMHRI